MPYLRDTVVILKKQPFREQDRRMWMYGREQGLLSAIARGASSPKSKQVGHLEPLSVAEVMIAKGAAFDTLAVASRIPTTPVSRRPSITFYVIAGALADLVIRLTRPGIADERIFELLRDVIGTLSRMPEEPSPERSRLLFAAATLKFLDLIGFAPQIEPAAPSTTAVPHLVLVNFLRHAPFADALRVTATVDVLNAASAFVEDALQHTPLEEEPHGMKTIAALLGT